MDQKEATLYVAEALRNQRFTNVQTLTPVEGEDPSPVVLAGLFGVTLSVTVEILAQP